MPHPNLYEWLSHPYKVGVFFTTLTSDVRMEFYWSVGGTCGFLLGSDCSPLRI